MKLRVDKFEYVKYLATCVWVVFWIQMPLLVICGSDMNCYLAFPLLVPLLIAMSGFMLFGAIRRLLYSLEIYEDYLVEVKMIKSRRIDLVDLSETCLVIPTAKYGRPYITLKFKKGGDTVIGKLLSIEKLYVLDKLLPSKKIRKNSKNK